MWFKPVKIFDAFCCVCGQIAICIAIRWRLRVWGLWLSTKQVMQRCWLPIYWICFCEIMLEVPRGILDRYSIDIFGIIFDLPSDWRKMLLRVHGFAPFHKMINKLVQRRHLPALNPLDRPQPQLHHHRSLLDVRSWLLILIENGPVPLLLQPGLAVSLDKCSLFVLEIFIVKVVFWLYIADVSV